MKKLIIFILTLLIFSMNVSAYEYGSETVNVFITVTDITDVNTPVNVIVPRTELEVSNFNITGYGDTYAGIELLGDGVTYLHALFKLHEQLYGAENVKDYFKMDSDKRTRIFMGRSVVSTMYKNGNDIFAIPNFIRIRNGDELNICLYNEGYSQGIATFNEHYVYASPGEEITLSLSQHYTSPIDNNPVSGQEITDIDGFYITDENGCIISTDENGNAQLSFSDLGEHSVSIMPKINYYLSEDGGKTVIEWVEEEVKKEIYHPYGSNPTVTASDTIDGEMMVLPEGSDEYISAEEAFGNSSVVGIFNWDDDTDFTDAEVAGNGKYLTYTSEPWTETVITTELVRHEYFVSGEMAQMLQYTTPICIINITNELVFTDVKLNNTGAICARVKNVQNYENCELYCALYKYDNGVKRLVNAYSREAEKYNVFRVKEEYDEYKLMIMDGMTPLCTAYSSATNIQELDWNYMQPKPENVIVSE